MNKTKIEWTDYTWNPITGCLNGCFYCYGRKMYQRFKKDFTPKIHYDRLSQPVAHIKPAKIFTCSISDLWGKSILPIWRSEVWNIMYACPEHTFLTLTKQPQNISKLDFEQLPENLWLGVTITGIKDNWKTTFLSPNKGIKFISFEPLLGNPNLNFNGYEWIIIGAMTGIGSKKYQPKKQWIKDILQQANRLNIPVFMKDNLSRVWKGKLRQEFPKGDW